MEINEKSVSKQQQKFFGVVRGIQTGEIKSASPAAKKAAASMSKKDVKDFAATKHKGLPKKVDELKTTKENVKSADKKPEVFTKPDGKRGVRMVSVDREVVKTEETDDIKEKGKGLWHNIRAKRKRGEPRAKPGDKDYPKTLDIEGYIGGKGEKGRDKGNAGKFDKNTAYSHAKTHNGVVHKDTSGSYLVKHGRGKNVSESVELDEAINFRKAHQEIMAYAKKHGDIDKEDFEKVASYIKEIGDNQNKPDRANLRFATMKAFVAGMDTDPRDKVYSWLKKYGMFKNGKMVQESESVDEVYRKPPTPIGGKGSSAKYKEAEAEYDREKTFARMRNQRKPIKKESSKEYGKSLDRIRDKEKKAKIKPSELDKLARLRNMMKNANNEGKTFESFRRELLDELTDKQKAEIAARKAKNLAKRGARRGPSKGTKSSEGDWTAQQQKSAKPLSFEINKNDKHDAVHKTLAKAADASHPSLGGRKVTVKINGKSKEMAHKDLQHAVDLHKRLPLGKKAAVMNLIRDKGHDGVTAAANHFRKTYK